MSNKIAKLTPEERQKQEDERYMMGRPNRMEVANYVNALLENQYLPQIQGQVSLGFMVIQAILIEKGICTGEDIEKMTHQFIQQRQQEAEKAEKEKETKNK